MSRSIHVLFILSIAACADAAGPASDGLEGTWMGWGLRNTWILELESRSGGRVSGTGEIVGLPYQLSIQGSITDASIALTVEPGAGVETIRFDGTIGSEGIRGRLNGAGMMDDSLVLRRRQSDPDDAPPWSRLELPAGVQPTGIEAHDAIWLLTARDGLYASTDQGRSWSRLLKTAAAVSGENLLAVEPGDPSRIAVAAEDVLHRSSDGGSTWLEPIRFPRYIGAVHLGEGGRTWVGTWAVPPDPSPGLHHAEWGADFELSPYGLAWANVQLIPWDIARIPGTDHLFVPTEIRDHPDPYAPPLFHSGDGGETWQDRAGESLFWHARDAEATPEDLFTLLEGAGLFHSSDRGVSWVYRSRVPGVYFAISPQEPRHILVSVPDVPGAVPGAYLSRDGGWTFEPFGLRGQNLYDVAFTPDGHALAVLLDEAVLVRTIPH